MCTIVTWVTFMIRKFRLQRNTAGKTILCLNLYVIKIKVLNVENFGMSKLVVDPNSYSIVIALYSFPVGAFHSMNVGSLSA